MTKSTTTLKASLFCLIGVVLLAGEHVSYAQGGLVFGMRAGAAAMAGGVFGFLRS